MMSDLRQFRKHYPDAEVTIEESGPQQQVAAILAGQIDVGYTPDNSTTHSPGITVYQAGRWKMMVALADDHPLAAHACLTVEMLAGEPLVLHDTHDNHEQLYLVLGQILVNPLHVVLRFGSTLSVLAIAAAGLGLALIPAPLQQVNIPGLVYRSLNAPEVAANLVIIGRATEPGRTVAAYLALATQSHT